MGRDVILRSAGVLVLAAILVSGCTRDARLYPANDAAAIDGVLVVSFVDSPFNRNGELELKMPDGELLKGEYSTVENASASFGTIYASVYGTGGSAQGSATAVGLHQPGSTVGMASAFGNQGTRLECEYFVNNRSGKGGGACKTSRGGLYRMHF